jgi:hypothetical protein
MMARTRGANAGGSPYYARDLGVLDAENDVASTNTANRVYYSPLQVAHQLTADGIIVIHGAVAAGNLYVALYDSLNYAPNNRLAVSASVVASGTNRRQLVPFSAPVQIPAGLYFVALEANNATDTYLIACGDNSEINPAGILNGLNYYREQLGGYLAPPLVATPVQETVTYAETVAMFLRVSSIP